MTFGAQPESIEEVASFWEAWCGETPWSRNLRIFAGLGGEIIYYGGVPQSVSATVLCFDLILPDGTSYEAPDGKDSRLKDIKNAIVKAKET